MKFIIFSLLVAINTSALSIKISLLHDINTGNLTNKINLYSYKYSKDEKLGVFYREKYKQGFICNFVILDIKNNTTIAKISAKNLCGSKHIEDSFELYNGLFFSKFIKKYQNQINSLSLKNNLLSELDYSKIQIKLLKDKGYLISIELLETVKDIYYKESIVIVDEKSTYKGSLYESNIIAFISDFYMTVEKDKIHITYPKYSCQKVSYNKKEINKTYIKDECDILNNYFNTNKINVPNKICTDIYSSYKYRDGLVVSLNNIKTPCFSFSKDLKGITLKEKKDSIEILQFYSDYGLFQAEVHKIAN